MTPMHGQPLPECEKEHDTMWKFFYGTAGFFVLFLSVSTPLVIGNFNDVKAAQQEADINLKEAQLVAAKQHAEMIERFDARTTAIRDEVKMMQAELRSR